MSTPLLEPVSHSLITPELAAAIEKANADLLRSLADHAGGRTWSKGDSCAAYVSPGSPLNQCVAADLTPACLDEIKAFYADCGSGFEFGVTAFTSQEMFDELAGRGWPIIEREQVMVLDLEDGWPHYPDPAGVELRLVQGDDADKVADAMVDGFFGPSDGPPGMTELVQMSAQADGYALMGAFEADQAAGGANVAWSGEIGWLRGGSVREPFRHRGIHKALQSRRLEILKEKGCQIAIMGALPGSTSQLNAQKLGFQIAYTRLSFYCSKPG